MLRQNMFIKNLMIFVQVLALSFGSQIAWADPNPQNTATNANSTRENAVVQKFVLNMNSVKTADGESHIETDTYVIQNEAQLLAVEEQIKKTMGTTPKADHVHVFDVSSAEHQPSQLDEQATQLAKNLAEEITTQNLRIVPAQQVDIPTQKAWIKKDYNLVLTVVRFVVNSSLISYGLVTARGIPVESALFVGILTGAITAGFQYYNKPYSDLLANSMFLVKTARKMNLLPASEDRKIKVTENILKDSETFVKMGAFEVGFLGVVQLAMLVAQVPITENIFSAAAKSLTTQGTYTFGLIKTTNELKILNPHLAGKASVMRDSLTLAGSILSVVGAVGTMCGIPFADFSFVILIGGSIYLNLTPLLLKAKPIKNAIIHWRPTGAAPSCRSLMSY